MSCWIVPPPTTTFRTPPCSCLVSCWVYLHVQTHMLQKWMINQDMFDRRTYRFYIQIHK
jgi:hypothetical protein